MSRGGGGLHFANGSNATFTNGLIIYNSARKGGGAFTLHSDANANLDHVTIAGNVSLFNDNTGGIDMQLQGNLTAMLTMTNCIISANTPHDFTLNHAYYGNRDDHFNISYSLVSNGFSGEGNIYGNPLFCNPNELDLFYTLGVASPCNGTGSDGSDMGAYSTLCVDSNGDFIDLYNGPFWFVDSSGSNLTGDGSLLQPFQSIYHAMSLANMNDTVIITPGEYFINPRRRL